MLKHNMNDIREFYKSNLDFLRSIQMKVSYSHLVSQIKENPSIEMISESLFQLGHEHEIDGDILNMELTPNRGDCLSINGLLRDLSAF